jgi:hypothetical protein
MGAGCASQRQEATTVGELLGQLISSDSDIDASAWMHSNASIYRGVPTETCCTAECGAMVSEGLDLAWIRSLYNTATWTVAA